LFSPHPWDKILQDPRDNEVTYEGTERETTIVETALEKVLRHHDDDHGPGRIIDCRYDAFCGFFPGCRALVVYDEGEGKMEVVMKELKTVEELIHSKNLTAGELELHKELIEECRAREARIAEYSRIAQVNLEKLSQSLTTLKQRAVVLGDALKVLQERADNLYLKLLPEEIFYHE
jgi:hypothetical protein